MLQRWHRGWQPALIWAGRMMRIKNASRTHCSGVNPGATVRASHGARAMPPRVSRVEAADGQAQRLSQAAESMTGIVQLIGSPETIARQIIELHEAGVDGVQVAFYDFAPDLDLFGRRVLPLLQEAGLRTA